MLHKEAGTSNEKTAAQMVYSKKIFFVSSMCETSKHAATAE